MDPKFRRLSEFFRTAEECEIETYGDLKYGFRIIGRESAGIYDSGLHFTSKEAAQESGSELVEMLKEIYYPKSLTFPKS